MGDGAVMERARVRVFPVPPRVPPAHRAEPTPREPRARGEGQEVSLPALDRWVRQGVYAAELAVPACGERAVRDSQVQ